MKAFASIVGFLLFSALMSASLAAALTEEQFKATFSGPNERVNESQYDSSHIWDYMLSVPRSDYPGFEMCWGYVAFVYETANRSYNHVYASTRTQNVFVVVVVNNVRNEVHGHRFLDLNHEYGLQPGKVLTRRCDARPDNAFNLHFSPSASADDSDALPHGRQ